MHTLPNQQVNNEAEQQKQQETELAQTELTEEELQFSGGLIGMLLPAVQKVR